ncbi:MAG: DUF378 domain-containing protein [Simkaniaceae bacterium]|nr:DUF378 domain-containing protein [Simkaniaceae bacterium]
MLRKLHNLSTILLIVGGIIWGLIAACNVNIIAYVFGQEWVVRIIAVVFGVAMIGHIAFGKGVQRRKQGKR